MMNLFTFGADFTDLPYKTQNIVTGAVLAMNFVLQIVICWQYRRSSKGSVSRHGLNRVQMVELCVYFITLVTNVFFVARMFPIWTDLSCLIFHGVIMAIFEIQLLAYSYVQLYRFGKAQLSKTELSKVTAALAILSIGLTAASAITQRGYVVFDQCHFIHDWRVMLASALFHLALDATFVALFRKHLTNARIANLTNSAILLHRIFFMATIILVVFGVWCVYLSIANLAITSLVLEISYNFHFTFIILALLAPRLARDFEKKNNIKTGQSTSTGVNQSVSSTHPSTSHILKDAGKSDKVHASAMALSQSNIAISNIPPQSQHDVKAQNLRHPPSLAKGGPDHGSASTENRTES